MKGMMRYLVTVLGLVAVNVIVAPPAATASGPPPAKGFCTTCMDPDAGPYDCCLIDVCVDCCYTRAECEE